MYNHIRLYGQISNSGTILTGIKFPTHPLPRVGKGAERDENRRTSRNSPNYNIAKIHQNTEKSPGDLWRLTVTQTLIKPIS